MKKKLQRILVEKKRIGHATTRNSSSFRKSFRNFDHPKLFFEVFFNQNYLNQCSIIGQSLISHSMMIMMTNNHHYYQFNNNSRKIRCSNKQTNVEKKIQDIIHDDNANYMIYN